MRRFSRLSTSTVAVAIFVPLVTVFASVVSGGSIYSPGPLREQQGGSSIGGAASHAELACRDCHAPFWSAEGMAGRCLDCHTGVQDQMDKGEGLHASFMDPADCRSCHTEHNGGDARLTLIDPGIFPHEGVGFSLAAHTPPKIEAAIACADCHGGSYDQPMADRCDSCHTGLDTAVYLEHTMTFGTVCMDCHDGVDHYGADFRHSQTGFALLDKHAGLNCADCHGAARSTADLRAAPTDCIGCHGDQDPHEARLGDDCAACHDSSGWDVETFDHRLAGFPLVGSHADVACADCHQQGATVPIDSRCVACHQQDDVHDGRLGDDCAACHASTTWTDVIPEDFDHSVSRFPLTGAHSSVACIKCHQGGEFAGTPMQCASCHLQDDAHNGSLGTQCASCHRPTQWSDATFDHQNTRFPLTGQHAGTACTVCHASAVFAGTPRSCVACHRQDDPHNGEFGSNCAACHNTSGWGGARFDHTALGFQLTGAHMTAQCADCHIAGRFAGTPTSCIGCHQGDDAHDGGFGADCAACHNTTSWNAADFDHASTGFPLTGRHQSAQCTDCHKNGQYAGTPSNCVSCHQNDDAHNGAFGSNCADCHSPSGWGGATFDHASTGFPLTGRHQSAQCTDCHQNGQYAGTPSSCVSCHQSDDAHNGAFGTNCATCHSPSGWGGATFDHASTGFPLTGRHTSAQCTDCHQNGQYAGTPSSCAGCHSEPSYHAGMFGTACASCHTTTAWQPASYSGPHTFPMDHRGAAGQCSRCHPSSLDSYTCYRCHDQAETEKHHREKGITDLSNCVACHPTGRGD
jgi:hypothetical protein